AYEGGVRDAEVLRAEMREVLAGERLAAPEYVSCADTATLRELTRVEGPALLSLAVRFGTVRLIDNEPLP
ncbi:MAG: pantoate--beta-alanine ligase, partial [Candidatus Limnocylindrales bacterium]